MGLEFLMCAESRFNERKDFQELGEAVRMLLAANNKIFTQNILNKVEMYYVTY